MSLIIATSTEDSTKTPNDTVPARLNRLHNQIMLERRATNPIFMVLMAFEFQLMHGHESGGCLRWYTKAKRDETSGLLKARQHCVDRMQFMSIDDARTKIRVVAS